MIRRLDTEGLEPIEIVREPIITKLPEPIIEPIKTVEDVTPLPVFKSSVFDLEALQVVESPVKLFDVKNAVVDLAQIAVDSVKIVRDSFTTGIAPLQVATSASVSSYIESFIDTRITKAGGISKATEIANKIVKSTSHLGLHTSTAGSSVPPPKPELDSAEVFEGPGGVLDQFSVKLTISIPVNQMENISSVKIMRSKGGPLKVPRPALSALINAPSLPSSGKGFDPVAMAAFRAADSGVGNKLTTFIADDQTANQRAVTSPDAQELRPPVPPQNTNRTGTSAGLLTLAGADRAVLENTTFYINRRMVGDLPEPEVPVINAGNRMGVNVLKGNSVSAVGTGIVQNSNPMNFAQIGKVDMGSPSTRRVGDFLETTFVDKSVVYGAGYTYYVSCIGKDDAEGPRSRLVNVPVVRSSPPKTPNVTFSIIGGHPRFVVRCPDGTDHVEVFRAGRPVIDSIKLGTDKSLVTQGPATKVGQYWHLTDLGLGADRSTTFVDDEAVSGGRLTYRFYSVDSFGLKSQTPFSCSLKMPEHGRPVPLAVPSVTAEQSAGQPSVNLKMQVDDGRVAGFIVQRRDVTIKEKSVHQANQPEWVDIGLARDAKRAGSRRGPAMLDADWPVYIPAAGGSASFNDGSVRVDRVYQYAVSAVDIRGNRTLMVGTNPVGVYVKTIIDPPTSFGAKVTVQDGVPSGVLLTWTGGTNDFSPNSLLDDQDVLAATSVRTVYQVERRQVGAPFWDAMPATSESYFIDPVSSNLVPAFRPPYVVPGTSYEYRVSAMQSGGFLSPRTDAISVSIVPEPTAPEMVWVKSTPLNVNPLAVIVSWEMPSQFVDRWEIERAATNKIYGAQIPSMDSDLARSLPYVRVAEITPESSRGRGLSTSTADLDKAIYVGNRFYVDSDVSRANMYFYRVRTVSALGVSSDWSYGGVVMNDTAFDNKFYSTLSDDVKIALAEDARPLLRTFEKALDEEPVISPRLKTMNGLE